MNKSCLLSTAYWAPIQYYAKLYACDQVVVEAYEHYIKQTYRNRCIIASPSGTQILTIPIVKPESEKCAMKDIRISDHGNWRHLHWNALESSYRNSPYFEYYADDFLPFYTKRWEFLLDFNEAIREKVCELINLNVTPVFTTAYGKIDGVAQPVWDDFKNRISPKIAVEKDKQFCCPIYYQLFQEKNGFIPNLSIADLLFNMGPESLLVLRDSVHL